jgi:hypothetical protein
MDITNYLGIRAVSITPKGDVIRIEGKNGVGKSATINSIWAGLGGLKEVPTNPIRNGEKDARIFLDLGEFTVERKFTENNTYLKVMLKDGFEIKKGQTFLDQYFSKVSLDPMAFIDMKKAGERREFLLNLIGKKDAIDKLDVDRKAAYDDRTLKNREVVKLKALIPEEIDTEAKEVSVAALMAKLEAAQDEHRAFADLELLRNDHKDALSDIATDRERIMKEIAKLNADLAALDTKEVREKELLDSTEKLVEEKRGLLPDLDAIRQEISDIEQTNARYRAAVAARAAQKDYDEAQAESDKMTAQIASIDAQKTELLASAKLPVPDLRLIDDDLWVGDVPFDSLNTASQLKVAMRLGIAANPKIRVLRFSEGSKLDSDSLREVEAFAVENDVQVWMERVCDSPQGGIFIKDGMIVDAEWEDAPEQVESAPKPVAARRYT